MNVAPNLPFIRVFGNRDLETQCRYCEHASILVSLENLVTYPWVKERLLSGDLALNGCGGIGHTGYLWRYLPASILNVDGTLTL